MDSDLSLKTEAKFPSPFAHATEYDLRIVTLVERRMRVLAAQILDKPNWWVKVNDAEIVAKWRKEFVEQDAQLVEKHWPRKVEAEAGHEDEDNRAPRRLTRENCVYFDFDEETYERKPKPWPRDVMTDTQLNYIFDWLKWMAETRDDETCIESTVIPNVYQAAKLIPDELKQALIKGASALESVPDEQKDWHPGTDNQVLDLVHPSLHCFRIGKSFVKKDDGSLYVPTVEEYMVARPDFGYIPHLPDAYAHFTISRQHQWLPTDFHVSSTGEVSALGYINNLHPINHKPMYSTITSIIQRFIPLWERVLSDTLSPQKIAIEVDPFRWYEPFESTCPQYPITGEGLKDWEKEYERWEAKKYPIVPDPQPFTPLSAEERVDFILKGRKLQIIVKMANIILTPENPEYEGGAWHVEGMENERIVATGLYYYDCANITESKLSFRRALCDGMDMPYQQSDTKGFFVAYGINGDGGQLNQELGSVITKEDKCLAFPNVYQHCVTPFELEEGQDHGHRKILCFFLVDPNTPILSTSQVPPQQYDWYFREMERAPALQALPQELFDMVRDKVVETEDGTGGGVINIEEAKEERSKLMEERSNFVIKQNDEIFEMTFNMCEH